MPAVQQCSRLAILTILGLSLSACGGGGGTTAPSPTIVNPPTAPTTPTTPNTPDPDVVASFKTDEFNLSWGLDTINAADAYALGFTGENALIAVVDFNFDLETTELNLHPQSVGSNPVNVAIYEAQIGDTASTSPHGHAVAVTAAGVKNDSGIHGVAFDAQVIAVDFFSGVNSRQVVQNGILYTVSDPWTYAFNLGARIFNKSFGYDEDDVIENPPQVSQRYTIEFDTRAVELGALVVSSAGNNSDPEPSQSNLDAIDRLRVSGNLTNGPGAYIIAGSVDEDLELSSFSDAAGNGIERFHYLVAPGGQVTFPWTEGLVVGSGTSFAAPYISGAAAVIMSRWPSLTAREVADIMFDTATDLGAPGIDSIYGNGLLNLEAAMQPVGQAKLAVNGAPAAAVTDAAIHLPPMFGDAQALQDGLANLMILDTYYRDFYVDGSTLVTSNRGRNNIEARFDARRNWQSAGLGFSDVGHLSYAVSRDVYSTPGFALAGQAEEDFTPEVEAVFEFTGQTGATEWVAGTGRSLSSALAREPYSQAAAGGFSLTGTGDSILPTGDGPYFAVNQSVSETTDMWIGVSQSRLSGQSWHALSPLQDDSSITAMAARIDHYRDDTRLSAEFGISHERGSLFGGRSTGALQFADTNTTSWLTLLGGWQLSDTVSLESSATVAVTDAGNNSAGVIHSLGTITSSAFKLKATMSDILSDDDVFTVTFHQPLRVEGASALVTTGTSLHAETGAVQFSDTRVSLAPAGREIALEAAYRRYVKGWFLEANMAYRHDAGHFSGQQDALLAVNISRRF